MARPRGPFDPPPRPLTTQMVPPLTVIAGSLITLMPIVAAFPILPPFGLMMLLGWRLTRIDSLPIWSPLLLGLVDDLYSGQPFGNAMLFWTVSFLALESIDQRLVGRDFWQDWLLASTAISAYLLFGRLVASPLAAHVDTIILVQIAASIMLYPVVAQIVSSLDRRLSPA